MTTRCPLYSNAGKTDNDVLRNRHEIETDLSAIGFEGMAVRGASDIEFSHLERRLARRLLAFYNLYERAMSLPPVENRWGTFLVSSARRPSR